MAVRKRKVVRKVLVANSTYINPLDCDSTISYKIISGSRGTYGSMQLADCGRKIDWYFGKLDLPKLDKVVETMQNFRTEFAASLTTDRKARRRPAAKRFEYSA
jgi:hypothetical protein